MLRTKLESTEVWVLHQCGARIADTELWSNTGNGWGLHISATIRDDGKIINDPRLQIRLLYEATSYGTGFDSRPVLLHRVDTLDWGRTRSQVDVCSHREISYYDRKLRKRETGTVLSCSPTTVECPASGCVEPTFVNGVLTMQSASGPVTATHRR